MIKAVVFDLDNTLLDFMKMKSVSINAAVEGMIKCGMQIDKTKSIKEIFHIYDNKGYEHQEVFNEFIISKIGKINYKFLAASIVEYKKAKEISLGLYPEVIPTLKKLQTMNLKLGIASDAPSREAWTRLYSVGLDNIFDRVVTSDETNAFKPSPAPFNLILKYFNILPAESVMVGDWPERDLDGAKNVGMRTAFARYGASSFNEQQYDSADVVLDHIGEILDYIIMENNK